jgi:adenosylcobinamide kinase/adenosylcobinamide-phosphate guanylyltransferase
MGRLIVYLGGVRSGKSELAEARFLKELKKRRFKPYYLATVGKDLLRKDASLKARVAVHQARRPPDWETQNVGESLAACALLPAFLLDGFGLWLARHYRKPWEALKEDIDAFLVGPFQLGIVVLDEVGLGGVSGHPAGRLFADRNGMANRLLCGAAQEVWRVDAGLASRLK